MKGASKPFLICLLLLITLSAWLVFQGRGKPNDYQGKEALVHIRSGQGSYMSYGLHQARSIDESGKDNGGYEFVLLLRNTGAKFIQLGEITEKNFSMTDAKGKRIEVRLHAISGGSLAFYDSKVVQFDTGRDKWITPPFSLRIDSGTNALDKWSLDIGKFDPAVRK